MESLELYTYSGCSTCRKAVQWLDARAVPYVEKPIRETPPSLAELRRMLRAQGGAVRKLCNTSGRDYRELKLGARLPELTEDAVLALLASNGNLVKRPFALGKSVALVGFVEKDWEAALEH